MVGARESRTGQHHLGGDGAPQGQKVVESSRLCNSEDDALDDNSDRQDQRKGLGRSNKCETMCSVVRGGVVSQRSSFARVLVSWRT